jgi:hypothetical protein
MEDDLELEEMDLEGVYERAIVSWVEAFKKDLMLVLRDATEEQKNINKGKLRDLASKIKMLETTLKTNIRSFLKASTQLTIALS